ncbi:MAG TPA: hypothetical protein VFL42_15060 [Terriglobales bacterium]|jgi:hypothetical protein|nr:hypothetical protein [Terriglobales bacterium]
MQTTLKREQLTTAALLVLVLVLLASYSYSKDSLLALRGAIEDSQCAFNVHSEGHSHDWMIKKGVSKDAKSCTQHCVRDMGGKYVLVVKDEVYRFDNESAAENFAGMRVKITANLLDAKSHTVHIVSIEKE